MPKHQPESHFSAFRSHVESSCHEPRLAMRPRRPRPGQGDLNRGAPGPWRRHGVSVNIPPKPWEEHMEKNVEYRGRIHGIDWNSGFRWVLILIEHNDGDGTMDKNV